MDGKWFVLSKKTAFSSFLEAETAGKKIDI